MREISIIVPCYNVESYIDTCVASLVNQTLGLESMELIFIDDASEDATLERLKEWEKKYPENILVIACEKNGRQGTARNIGMQYADGKYIGFVDSDDWVELNMFELLVDKAETYNCDMVSCHAYRNKNNGEEVPEYTGKDESFIQKEFSTIEGGDWPKDFIGSVWSRIYRREMLQENNVFFPEGLCYEDNFFGVMAALYCKTIYKVQKCLYHYRENETSTTLMRNNKRLFDRLEIEVLKIKRFQELNLFQKFQEQIELDFFELYYFNTMYMMATRFDVPSYEVFQRMQEGIFEYFPHYKRNERLMESGNPVWDLLLKVLSCNFSREQFGDFMRKYAALPRR